MPKLWIEKNKRWDGEERFYVMTEGNCLASTPTLEEAREVFELSVKNYHDPIVEIIEQVEL